MNTDGANLQESLKELEEVTAEALEDGLEVPSETAFANARRLLEEMCRISPRHFAVYPDYDGYITLDTRGRHHNIMNVMCDSDGGVLCIVVMDGESRRIRHETAEDLPDEFIREALLGLGERTTR